MAVMRAFIAVDLPTHIHEKLDQVVKNLNAKLDGLPIRWVPSENIHLSLKFLGDVSESNLDMITRILELIWNQQNNFEVSVGSLGVFPTMRSPRVIWVGVEAPEELLSLHRKLEAETANIGYEIEARAYTPHLTLGRVSRNATTKEVRKIAKILEKEKLGFLGVVQIEDIHL
ncbi:MAG: RNA 2',3'-cyclic phosphodiesterase, partial [Chloroflexi bacterium]|nr:RNA 2',3'-cyclic phosphodiesterase [Chloroflexota bacterium]